MRIALQNVHHAPPAYFYGLTGLGESGALTYVAPTIRRRLPGYQMEHPDEWVTGHTPGGTQVRYPSIRTRLESMMQIWTQQSVSVGRALKPGECRPEMTAFANDYCRNNPFTCAGFDVNGIIGALCEFYNRWYDALLIEYYDMEASGQFSPATGIPLTPIDAPPPGYVAPSPAGLFPQQPQAPYQATQQGPLPTISIPATLINSPAPVQLQQTPAATPVFAVAPAPSPAPASQPGAGSSAAPAAGGGLLSDLNSGWMAEEMVSGVPNWGLLLGGIVLAWFVFGGKR